MARHNETGALGEDIACRFLVQHGFQIVARNYRKPWGEIDIVARETSKDIIHFVEVKSTLGTYPVSRENTTWDPVEMVHPMKLRRLQRVVETYCAQHDVSEWVFDVLLVYINKETRIATCKMLSDVVL